MSNCGLDGPDWERVREEVWSTGFSILRGVHDPIALSFLADAVEAKLVAESLSDGSRTEVGQLCYTSSPTAKESALTFEGVARDERVEHVFQRAGLLEGIKIVLHDDEVFSHPTKWMRVVPPNQSQLSSPAGVHQDYLELQGSPRQLTMWTPIYPVSAMTGSLPVYPRPAGTTILPMKVALNASGWEVKPSFLRDPTSPDLEVGDAILFTTFTPHGGASNSGQGWRASIESRYQPLREAISEPYLNKPLLLESWDEQYRGWRRFGHYWRERKPKAVAFDSTWERWRDLAGIEQGLMGNREAMVALRITARFGKDPALQAAAATLVDELNEATHE